MIFFQEQYQYLASSCVQMQNYAITQFANQEFLISLQESVVGKDCLVVGSLTSPAEQALILLQLIDTLKNAQAARVVLFAPYLSYQRQDKLVQGKSIGLLFADTVLSAVHVDSIITCEPHNLQALQALQVPVVAYSSQYFFEQEVAYFVSIGFGFVFADVGAKIRHHWLQEQFPMAGCGVFTKSRNYDLVALEKFEGKVGRKVILYDDILDSGQTLLAVCIMLSQMQVEEIVIFVTHAFFHGVVYDQLWNFGVKKIYCTNSLPAANKMVHENIEVKDIKLFVQKIALNFL
ncbi:MAG: ribose-phosphate diphosphokinase [Candidatus Chromulinivorax sp.]